MGERESLSWFNLAKINVGPFYQASLTLIKSPRMVINLFIPD